MSARGPSSETSETPSGTAPAINLFLEIRKPDNRERLQLLLATSDDWFQAAPEESSASAVAVSAASFGLPALAFKHQPGLLASTISHMHSLNPGMCRAFLKRLEVLFGTTVLIAASQAGSLEDVQGLVAFYQAQGIEKPLEDPQLAMDALGRTAMWACVGSNFNESERHQSVFNYCTNQMPRTLAGLDWGDLGGRTALLAGGVGTGFLATAKEEYVFALQRAAAPVDDDNPPNYSVEYFTIMADVYKTRFLGRGDSRAPTGQVYGEWQHLGEHTFRREGPPLTGSSRHMRCCEYRVPANALTPIGVITRRVLEQESVLEARRVARATAWTGRMGVLRKTLLAVAAAAEKITVLKAMLTCKAYSKGEVQDLLVAMVDGGKEASVRCFLLLPEIALTVWENMLELAILKRHTAIVKLICQEKAVDVDCAKARQRIVKKPSQFSGAGGESVFAKLADSMVESDRQSEMVNSKLAAFLTARVAWHALQAVRDDKFEKDPVITAFHSCEDLWGSWSGKLPGTSGRMGTVIPKVTTALSDPAVDSPVSALRAIVAVVGPDDLQATGHKAFLNAIAQLLFTGAESDAQLAGLNEERRRAAAGALADVLALPSEGVAPVASKEGGAGAAPSAPPAPVTHMCPDATGTLVPTAGGAGTGIGESMRRFVDGINGADAIPASTVAQYVDLERTHVLPVVLPAPPVSADPHQSTASVIARQNRTIAGSHPDQHRRVQGVYTPVSGGVGAAMSAPLNELRSAPAAVPADPPPVPVAATATAVVAGDDVARLQRELAAAKAEAAQVKAHMRTLGANAARVMEERDAAVEAAQTATAEAAALRERVQKAEEGDMAADRRALDVRLAEIDRENAARREGSSAAVRAVAGGAGLGACADASDASALPFSSSAPAERRLEPAS